MAFAGRIDLVILETIVPDMNKKAVYSLPKEALAKLKERTGSGIPRMVRHRKSSMQVLMLSEKNRSHANHFRKD